jgi:hypothetical protein
MYGMVNDAVRGLVKKAFGDDVWTHIHTVAGAPESFVPMKSYDDEVTYGLVAAAVDVLDVSASDVLKTFGQYWVSDVATVHYADIMANTGIGFVDFVKNLDHMHQRLRTTFPDYDPPSFRVLDIEPGLIQVDYYSGREGLLPFVVGLFEGLGRHFSEEITIEHVDDDKHPLPCRRMLVSHRLVV